MKKKVILVFLSVVLVIALTATPVFAKEPDKGASGVPFQELWDAVAGLQEQLDEAVSTLQAQIDEIDSIVQEAVEDAIEDAILALSIDWNQIAGVPSGFADGVDNEGAGDGHSLDAADSTPVDAVYVDNDGEVGIGTTSPNHRLDVAGHINSSESFKLDGDTVLSDPGTWNILVGKGAGASITTGSRNSAMGAYALRSNTTGGDNSAMGYQALYSNTMMGAANSAVGANALRSNTTGLNNSAMGYRALYSNTGGLNNSAMGAYALYSNTIGSFNSAMGNYAGFNNIMGYGNTFVGYNAGRSNSTGGKNVFLGYRAGYNEAGSNKLYIANSEVDPPLIHGDFTTGKVSIKNLHLLPQSTPPTSPSEGDIYYDEGEHKLKCFDGTSWQSMW